ncbi:MAG: imidazole glycerol phosphate synthase subunit HisH [Candidatus Gottesmanbacteria bacterium]|nr:imidazole glycerol phosphate synthase subunit HisH [Candidatus Gottesmanbacteria bacterium]
MITIIDYGLGNIGSVANTLTRLGQTYQISADPAEIRSADVLLLPGVGAAGVGMKNLRDRGLDVAIRRAIQNGKPFLGICLGMQLLFDYSEEADTPCLGILKGSVKKFQRERKVPQIGWNLVIPVKTNPNAVRLFAGIPERNAFYFVNSYYPIPADTSVVAATTEYGEQFASVVAIKNIVATQFHPEKSGETGLRLLQNFIKEYV